MTELKNKVIQSKLLRGKYIKLPEVIIEENALSKSTQVEVHYGSNYKCAIILPIGAKLGDIQKERINKLLSEPLETQR